MPSSYNYSKPLQEKLGIKENSKMAILNPPEGYFDALGKLPRGAVVTHTLNCPVDFIQYFVAESRKFKTEFPMLKKALTRKGMLWVCWPKASSNVKTDLNEGRVREVGLKDGLVDVKVIAVDEVWSGLKFVYRVEERGNIEEACREATR